MFFLDLFTDGGIGLMYSTYLGVASFYNFMIKGIVNNNGIFNSNLVDNAIDVLYSFMGLFMLFRISINLLQYLVNPDKATDKNIGGGKLVTHVLISIVLYLTLNSFIIPLSKKLQDAIIGTGEATAYDVILKENATDEELQGMGLLPRFFYNIQHTKSESKTSANLPNKTKSNTTSLYQKTFAKSNCYNADLSSRTRDLQAGDQRFENIIGCQYDLDTIKSAWNEYYKGSHVIKQDNSWIMYFTSANEQPYELIREFQDGYYSSSTGEQRSGKNGDVMYSVCLDAKDTDCYNINYQKYPANEKDTVYGLKASDIPDKTILSAGYTIKRVGNEKDEISCKNSISTGCAHFRIEIYLSVLEKYSTGESGDYLDCYYIYHGKDASDNYLDLTYTKATFFKLDSKLPAVLTIDGRTITSSHRVIKNDYGSNWYISYNDSTGSRSENYANYIIEDQKEIPLKFTSASFTGEVKASFENKDDAKKNLANGKCPTYIENIQCSPTGTGGTDLGWVCNNQTGKITYNTSTKSTSYLYKGTTNFQELFDNVSPESKKPSAIQSEFNIDLACQRNGNSCEITEEEKETEENRLDQQAQENQISSATVGANFAGGLLLAFVDKQGCEDTQGNCDLSEVSNLFTSDKILTEKEALQTLKDKNNDKTIAVWWFLGLVFAIITIGFIAILCIDLTVRNCKLILLQILAPIAIFSYMDPKDKTLGQWAKQYVAAYVDLFLKLIAIYCVAIFINLLSENVKGIGSAFIALGVLTFAKIVPDFISKIFGIKDAAGSFKESAKMLKTAAFSAAGAGIGLGAAGLTGIGAFRATKGQGGWARFGSVAQSFGTALSSTIRGASGGAKGNILAGQKHASATNARRRELYESGVGVGAAMLAGATFGIYNPNHKDEQIEQAYDDLLNKRKDLDSRVEGEINKGKDNYRMTEDSISKSLLGKNYAEAKKAGYLDPNTSSKDLEYMMSGSIYDAMSDHEKSVLNDAYYTKKAIETTKGMKIQDFNNFRNSDEFKNLSGVEASKYDKLYADEMNEAKAQYVQDVKANRKEDSQAVAYMDTYDRAVEAYSKKYGKKDGKDKDANYAYDFTSLTTTDQIHDGDSYKATKSQAEDARIKFSNSSTRANHYKQEKANN